MGAESLLIGGFVLLLFNCFQMGQSYVPIFFLIAYRLPAPYSSLVVSLE